MAVTALSRESSARETARFKRLEISKLWLYWWPNWDFTDWAVSRARFFRGISGADRLRLTKWVRAAPERKARGLPWDRATTSAPSRSSSGCSTGYRWLKRPTPTAEDRLPGVEEELNRASMPPRVSRLRASSIRVSMQWRRHSSGCCSSQQKVVLGRPQGR